eukprot:jgi/Bigna1/88311/estExt_fgenesh1_pg.C_300129
MEVSTFNETDPQRSHHHHHKPYGSFGGRSESDRKIEEKNSTSSLSTSSPGASASSHPYDVKGLSSSYWIPERGSESRRLCALYGLAILAALSLVAAFSYSIVSYSVTKGSQRENGGGGGLIQSIPFLRASLSTNSSEYARYNHDEATSSTSNNVRIESGSGFQLPTSKLIRPTIRWGIAGLGRIAHEFAVALEVSGMTIEAVAAGYDAEWKERAQWFAHQFNARVSYTSYEDLAKDPNVDIVYIAVINNLHKEVALTMFAHKKHVLCEKPTAMNYTEAQEMTQAAREAGVFFATNFWNSAFPVVRYVRNAIRQGAIGNIVQISGDMGFQTVRNYADRWLNGKMGGGSTMDMGCYLFQYLVMLTEEQQSVEEATGMMAKQQRDEFAAALLIVDTLTADFVTHPKVASPGCSLRSNLHVVHWMNTRRRRRRGSGGRTGGPSNSSINGAHSDGQSGKGGGRRNTRGEEEDEEEGGEEEEIQVLAAIGQIDPKSNVDVDSSVIMQYKGVTGRFGSSLIRSSPFELTVMGEHGVIRIAAPANCPDTASLTSFQDSSKTTFMPFPCCVQPLEAENTISQPLPDYPQEFYPQQYPRGTGFVYIIEAVEECLQSEEGCLELPDVSQDMALKVQKAVDEVRARLHAKV